MIGEQRAARRAQPRLDRAAPRAVAAQAAGDRDVLGLVARDQLGHSRALFAIMHAQGALAHRRTRAEGLLAAARAAWDGRTNSMGLTLYASSVPSDAVRRTFSPDKRTYITQLEMLAAVTTYRAAPAFAHAGVNLARRNVNHWIDNTGTLSGLIHGYARATDLAHMANAFHLTTCGMRTHTWLDYVPSLANIADLPSRGDFELLERLGARRVERPVVGTADWHGHNATSSGGDVP